MVLQELDEHARRELVESRFEDPEEASSIVDAVVERAGGNPLFIEEVLSHLLDHGTIGWNRQARLLVVRDRSAKIELPPTIEDALRSRIEGLTPKARGVLQGASILGMHFRGEELTSLLERDALPELEYLVGEQLLTPSPASPGRRPMRFATISLHEVCRSSVLPAQAVALHHEAARLKRQRKDYTPGRDDGPIAEHLLAANEYDAAIEPALRAAQNAADMGGNVEAYYHITQALKAMTKEDPRRFEALLQREPILRAWGKRRAQGADIRALITVAESLDDPVKEIIASTRLLRFYIECGRMHRATRLLPKIDAMAHRHHLEARFAAVLGELKSEIALARGLFEEAYDYAADALEHTWGDERDDRRGKRERFGLLRSLARVNMHTGRLDEARRHMNEAMALSRDIEHRRYEAEARTLLGEIAGMQARYQSAVDHFQAALAIDRELGDRYTTGVKLANLGITYTAIGLYRRAERYLRKALELHEAIGHPSLLNEVMVNLGEVSFELGDPEAARALLDEAISVAHDRDDVRTELRARSQLVRVLLADADAPGNLADAEAIARHVVEVGRNQGLRSAVTRGLYSLSRIALHKDNLQAAVRRAREACKLVRSGAARMDGLRCLHHLGLLLRDRPELVWPGEADEFLSEAALGVSKRLDGLRDPELRHGYEEQREVQQILEDHPG
jgi:tetratricopeptide (TPR) repeat protein